MTESAQPTGYCYCGCGNTVGYGRYFAAGHDKTAEAAFLAIHHEGTVAQMLHAHGYRGVADRNEKSSVTKAAVDQGLGEVCPKGCGDRGPRESSINHSIRDHQN